ncbi:hypothetical protein [Edaphobacter aggregans]|nr:hypothetical protein [Edaphobacter aggregans]
MKSLLKLLASIGKAFGISSPSDNVRSTPSRKLKSEQTSATSDSPSQPNA